MARLGRQGAEHDKFDETAQDSAQPRTECEGLRGSHIPGPTRERTDTARERTSEAAVVVARRQGVGAYCARADFDQVSRRVVYGVYRERVGTIYILYAVSECSVRHASST